MKFSPFGFSVVPAAVALQIGGAALLGVCGAHAQTPYPKGYVLKAPPVPASTAPNQRMRACLLYIANELRPDPKELQGRIASVKDWNTGSYLKHGVATMSANWDKSPEYAVACLAAGVNVEQANADIVHWCRDYPIDKDKPGKSGDIDPRKIFRVRLLPSASQLLTEEAKDAIEETAYTYIYRRSIIDPAGPDANNAGKSVWIISGSENHDAVTRMNDLLGSEIICRFGKKYTGETTLADGRTVKEHHDAWVAWWKEHTRQRAREGIFCEIAQPGSYGRATITSYFNLYDLVEDPELRRLGGNMLTLHFAQLATEFEPKTGTRGAIAITRSNDGIDQQWGKHWTKNLTFAWNWHDVPEDQILHGESIPFSTSYVPPPIVTAIARGPKAEPYFSVMRNFGLGERPSPDVYLITFADGEENNSYIRRTSWIAPEYMLSGITTDPARTDYTALNTQGRQAGISFSSGVNDRISMFGVDTRDSANRSHRAVNAIVAKDCLVAGRESSATSRVTNVYVSGGTVFKSRVTDPSGWEFFRAGDGFCAMRAAFGAFQPEELRNAMGYYFKLSDIDSPVIMQTGRAADYPGGFEEFRKAVLEKARLAVDGNAVAYTSLAGDTIRFWTREPKTPELNGKTFDLNPRYTYESPYLTMVHGTDIATVKYPGRKDVVLDFNYEKAPGPVALK